MLSETKRVNLRNNGNFQTRRCSFLLFICITTFIEVFSNFKPCPTDQAVNSLEEKTQVGKLKRWKMFYVCGSWGPFSQLATTSP